MPRPLLGLYTGRFIILTNLNKCLTFPDLILEAENTVICKADYVSVHLGLNLMVLLFIILWVGGVFIFTTIQRLHTTKEEEKCWEGKMSQNSAVQLWKPQNPRIEGSLVHPVLLYSCLATLHSLSVDSWILWKFCLLVFNHPEFQCIIKCSSVETLTWM